MAMEKRERREWRAGPVEGLFDGGDLRYFRGGGEEVRRRLDGGVRDAEGARGGVGWGRGGGGGGVGGGGGGWGGGVAGGSGGRAGWGGGRCCGGSMWRFGMRSGRRCRLG